MGEPSERSPALKGWHTVAGEAGIVSCLDVVEADRTALVVQRESARIHVQRRIAILQLIKTLGGGWQGLSPPEKSIDSARK